LPAVYKNPDVPLEIRIMAAGWARVFFAWGRGRGKRGTGSYLPESVVPALHYLFSGASWRMTGVAMEHRMRLGGQGRDKITNARQSAVVMDCGTIA
jgi:hypothetical protein